MKEKEENKILMTGGHAATTAIATIEKIKKNHPGWELFWVGPKSATEGKYVPTLASQVMPKLGVKYIPIITGRLQRRFTVYTIPSLLKVPYGTLQAIKIVRKIRPNIIISFGGYASVPVAAAAKIFGIPVVIHEQTAAAGLANKIVGKFADKILIARESSARFFSKEKTVLVGNPVREQFLDIKPKIKLPKMPTIYITGGSSGAHVINNVIFESLYELLQDYKVIHQTGKQDFERFEKIKNEFPTDLKENYEVHDFIDDRDIVKVFEKADIMISRAGANTISEILITKRPAILIPIPWVQNNEQTKNAELVVDAGLGVMIHQKDFNKSSLFEKLEMVIKNWKKMASSEESEIAELDKKASEKFLMEIENAIISYK